MIIEMKTAEVVGMHGWTVRLVEGLSEAAQLATLVPSVRGLLDVINGT